MKGKKAKSKPRSPVFNQIIDQFLAGLQADDLIENDTVKRLQHLFESGERVKSDAVKKALFPIDNSEL